jgi:hypothetical protein
MEENFGWCVICGNTEFAKFMRGFEEYPRKFIKCTRCGKEYPEYMYKKEEKEEEK